MKEIKLTKNQKTKVDDEDYDYLNRWKWQAEWNKDTKSYYAVRYESKKNNHQNNIRMNRQVMNTPKNLICDHINHDTLDNQKHNLRNVTHSQNSLNRKSYGKNNKLKERGITPNRNNYRVTVRKEGKTVFDRTYKNLDDARKARDEQIKKHHGDFSSI